jgi:hypothetical protein
MNSHSKSVYVLLAGNRLLEYCPNPTDTFLMRNYGKRARVLKISADLINQGERIITLDFHKGCLLIATSNALYGWNLRTGDWTQGIITDST